MGFFDKLRGRTAKAGDAEAGKREASSEVKAWVDGLFQQLQPDKLQLRPGETVGQAFARIVDAEEQKVRTSGDPPDRQQPKLAALDSLRQQLDIGGATPAEDASVSDESEGRLKEATFEMVLGGMEDIKEVPLTTFMQIVQGWGTMVESIGRATRISEDVREQYKSVRVNVAPGETNPELIARFHGTREMIECFRASLRRLGLESPAE